MAAGRACVDMVSAFTMHLAVNDTTWCHSRCLGRKKLHGLTDGYDGSGSAANCGRRYQEMHGIGAMDDGWTHRGSAGTTVLRSIGADWGRAVWLSLLRRLARVILVWRQEKERFPQDSSEAKKRALAAAEVLISLLCTASNKGLYTEEAKVRASFHERRVCVVSKRQQANRSGGSVGIGPVAAEDGSLPNIAINCSLRLAGGDSPAVSALEGVE